MRTGEAGKTHALCPDTVNEDHLPSKSPGTGMRTSNTPEGWGEFKGSDDESCSGIKGTLTHTYVDTLLDASTPPQELILFSTEL